jgi:hypothetical protein
MLTIAQEPDFITIIASGTLDEHDYERFVPEFERLAKERGKLPMVIDATSLDGWNVKAGWEELKFDVTHQDAFGPMAIIGDARWEEWGTKLAKPYFSAPMRYFRAGEERKARDWLRSASDSRST